MNEKKYPVSKEILINPKVEIEVEYMVEQKVNQEEMAKIEAIFEERKDRNDWSSGEELAKIKNV